VNRSRYEAHATDRPGGSEANVTIDSRSDSNTTGLPTWSNCYRIESLLGLLDLLSIS
jgi:hypothetical protein